jgi:AcrR family transcriptional regulator
MRHEGGTDVRSRRKTTKGSLTRQAILERSAALASIEGLDGLSIGRLAEALGMSKSGLFAHFKTKQELQLATIERASAIYLEEVIKPALAVPAGLDRLRRLCESFISYVERSVFPGGCFFAAAMAEFDAREGPVRNRIAEAQRQWLEMLERMAQDAKRLGQLSPQVDAAQLAYELESVMVTANWYVHLFEDRTQLERARKAVKRLLDQDPPEAF